MWLMSLFGYAQSKSAVLEGTGAGVRASVQLSVLPSRQLGRYSGQSTTAWRYLLTLSVPWWNYIVPMHHLMDSDNISSIFHRRILVWLLRTLWCDAVWRIAWWLVHWPWWIVTFGTVQQGEDWVQCPLTQALFAVRYWPYQIIILLCNNIHLFT